MKRAFLLACLSPLLFSLAYARQESPSENAETQQLIDAVFPLAEGDVIFPCGPWASGLPLQVKLTSEAVAATAVPQGLDAVVERLMPVIGSCLLKGKDLELPSLDGEGVAFDQTLLPYWNAKNDKVKGLDGKVVSKVDLVSIDALARTLYGEMAICFGKGLEYPQAVTKIVLNRVDFITENPKRKSLFTRGKPHELKSPLTQVLMSPYQFSTWNKRHGKKPNHSLKHVLCPPSRADAPFYAGHKPPKGEQKIWRQALTIAAQAVLEAKKFKQRTGGVKEYYYTSGLGKFQGNDFKRTYPSIGDKKITNARCVETWEEVKKK